MSYICDQIYIIVIEVPRPIGRFFFLNLCGLFIGTTCNIIIYATQHIRNDICIAERKKQ